MVETLVLLLTKRPLDKHQRRGIHFITRHNGQAGIFCDCGTGKTLMAIRYVEQGYFPALVICRRDDFLTWRTELKDEGYSYDDMTFIDKSKIKLPKTATKWTIITYDRVKRQDFMKWIKSIKWQIAIADEIHMIKKWDTIRTKRVINATRHIPRRLGLTATPVNNTLMDVYSECLFIDNGKTFGSNEWRFKRRYFIKPENFPGWFLRHGVKKKIETLMDKISFSVDADDVLDLPPQRSVIKSVPMTGMQRKYQKQILEEWELTIENETVDIDQVIVQLSKLRQVAAGFLYKPGGGIVKIKNNKMKLLSSLLNDDQYLKLKSKIVIWAAHIAEIELISQMLSESKIKCVQFHGSNRKRNNEARRQFLKNPKCRVFIGQADKGVGINELVVADSAVTFSNSFRVVSKVQAKKRIRRRGSNVHKVITYYELVTEKSIDEHILKSLNKNISVAESILEKLKQKTKLGVIFNDF